MSDSYDDYEAKIQLAEHAWEKRVVKTEHDRAVELGKAYERGWNAALAQRESVPEALRLADALDELDRQFSRNGLCGDAAAELRRLHEVNQDLLKALHEALETEQEPVAWLSEGGDVSRSKRYMDEMGFKCNPLYTAPPKREWVGLTDDDVIYFRYQATFCDEFDAAFMAELIEKDLKEKNHG